MKYTTVILAILLLGLALSADEKEEFKVLSKFGSVSIKRDGKENWKKVRTGDKVFKKDVLKVGKDSFVSLLYKTGICTTIDNVGEFTSEEIARDLEKEESRLSNKVFSNLLSKVEQNTEFFNSDELNQKIDMNSMVFRAIEGQPAISVRNPASSYFIDSVVEFSWFRNGSAADYKLVIKNLYDEKIYELNTKDSAVKINFADAGIKKGIFYFWYVLNGDARSEDRYIFRVKDGRAEEINDTVSIIKNEYKNGAGSLRDLALASYYEISGINNRAMEFYRKAMENNPGSEDLKRFYLLYLIRNDLLHEARSIIKK